MYTTLALTTLTTLMGFSQAQSGGNTVIRTFLDKAGSMAVDVDVPEGQNTAIAYGIFRADVAQSFSKMISCQILDSSGTLDTIGACESSTFDQGIRNASILCSNPSGTVAPPVVQTSFVVPPSATAVDPNVATASIEVDDDATDLAQQFDIPVNGAPVAIGSKVTDIIINSISSGASNVACQAWSDAGATAPLGQPARLNQEGDLRVNGAGVDVNVITCFTA